MADDQSTHQDDAQFSPGSEKAGSPERPAAAAAPAKDSGRARIGEAAGEAAAPSVDPARASQAAQPDDGLLGQEGIDKLLEQAGAASAEPAARHPAAEHAAADLPGGDDALLQGDVDYLLRRAEEALESINSADDDLPQGAAPFRLEEFSGAPASTESATLDLIRDVELDLRIELGRTHMYLEDVLKLRRGSVVPLDKLAGDPVDIYVNGRLIARGEVLVLSDNFCVRVAELIAGTEVSG
jgi:flagellar motor switch protein FliN/FliY